MQRKLECFQASVTTNRSLPGIASAETEMSSLINRCKLSVVRKKISFVVGD